MDAFSEEQEQRQVDDDDILDEIEEEYHRRNGNGILISINDYNSEITAIQRLIATKEQEMENETGTDNYRLGRYKQSL